MPLQNYIQFFADGMQQASPWSYLKNQIYLGSDGFVERVQAKLPQGDLSKIPKAQRRPIPKTLGENAKRANSRNEAIRQAYRSGATRYAKSAIIFRCIIRR